jgi:hypothetical protein
MSSKALIVNTSRLTRSLVRRLVLRAPSRSHTPSRAVARPHSRINGVLSAGTSDGVEDHDLRDWISQARKERRAQSGTDAQQDEQRHHHAAGHIHGQHLVKQIVTRQKFSEASKSRQREQLLQQSDRSNGACPPGVDREGRFRPGRPQTTRLHPYNPVTIPTL